jgi:hypothetical protein
MQIDETDARLGNRLQAWVQELRVTWATLDEVGRARSLRNMVAIIEDLERLKVEGLAAMRILLNQQALLPEDERVASLLRGFEFGAKLAASLSDEHTDADGHNEVVLLMNSMVDALDTIGSGRRTALVPLLEHPDVRVRASAGAYLLALMPDRVIPVLREVEETEHGNSAHFTAYWRLQRWELDGT